MARGRRSAGRRAAAAVAVGLLIGLSGCSVGDADVLVTGHDENGTAVVGAVNCGFDDRYPAAELRVRSAQGPGAGPELWSVDRPGRGLTTPGTGPPAPPEPQPRFVGGVELVAVGDPAPPGGDAVVAPAEELPDELVVEARAFSDDPEPFATAPLGRSGAADTYEVRSGTGEVHRDLDAVRAATVIDDLCATDDLFDPDLDLGPALVTMGVALAVLVVGGIVVGVVTVRQFRRAGARVAEVKAAKR